MPDSLHRYVADTPPMGGAERKKLLGSPRTVLRGSSNRRIEQLSNSLRSIIFNVSLTEESDLAEAERLLSKGHAKAAEGKHGSAVTWYNQALVLQRARLGEDSPEAGHTLHSIGISLMELGVEEDEYAALSALEEALYIRQKTHGDGSKEAAETMSVLWQILRRVREREERLEREYEAAEAKNDCGRGDEGKSSVSGRKSSLSQSSHSISNSGHKSKRFSVSIAAAIDEGRRRSNAISSVSAKDQELLAELVAELDMDGLDNDKEKEGEENHRDDHLLAQH